MGIGVEAIADEPLPFTDEARVRLMLSFAYKEVAELAMSGAATYADRHAEPGSNAADAAQIVERAKAALTIALVLEQVSGTSWLQIGEALGTTKQGAFRKYGEAVKKILRQLRKRTRWTRDALPSPEELHLPWEYRDPEEAAKALDRWLRDPIGASGIRFQANPGSAGLPRHTPLTMVMQAGRASTALTALQMVPDPQLRAECQDLEAQMFDRLLREGNTDSDWAALAIQARAQAAQYRATPGHGITWQEALGPQTPDESADILARLGLPLTAADRP